MSEYNIVSLFSGAGGLDLGFIQTGKYKIVFANEVLLSAATTYSRNIGLKLGECNKGEKTEAVPGYILACDVAQVDFSGLANAEIDLIIGGPPCQDFSIVRGPAWDRRGIDVQRGRLYAHFVRALVTLQPKIFLFENVPGLVSANDGIAYKIILEDFSNLNLRWKEVKKVIPYNSDINRINGYKIIYRGIVDFSKFGVPQRRERLIIIGIREDLIKRGYTSLRSAIRKLKRTVKRGVKLFYKYPLTPIEIFEGAPLNELAEKYVKIIKKWEGIWKEVSTHRAKLWKQKVWDKMTFDIINDYILVNGIDSTDDNELEKAIKEHKETLKELGFYGIPVYKLRLPDLTTELPKEDNVVINRMKRIPPGENHEFVRGTKWEVEGKGISLIYRRIHPLRPAYTIAAYGGGGTHGYHYDYDRATLTLREKARLQTFPDSFLFYGKKKEIRAQIGEAVPPLASKRIAEALAEVLRVLELD